VDGFRRSSPRNEILKSLGTECLGTEEVLSKRFKAILTVVGIIETNEAVVCAHLAQGRLEICELPGHANNLESLQTDIL
jgi:hypothetical protein